MRKIIWILAIGAMGAGLAAYAAPLPGRAKPSGAQPPRPEAARR